MFQPLLRPPLAPRAAEADAEVANEHRVFGSVRKQTLLSLLMAAMLVALIGRSVLESVAPDWSNEHLAPALLQHWRNNTASRPVLQEKPCEYGSLPGRWVSRGEAPPAWRLLDQRCALRPLLADMDTPPPKGEKPMGILLIGDSTDRQLVEAVCPQQPLYFANASDETPPFRALKCSLPGLNIAIYPIWGIFATGPFEGGYKEPRQVRIPRAFKLFQRQFGRSPDMVVLTSNFWDVGAMWKRRPLWMETRDDLPYDFFQSWLGDAADALQLVMKLAPKGTPVAWHTQHYPLADTNTGRNLHQPLGRRAHITQLNAAGRHVCSAHSGCHLVDIELMAAQWGNPSAYLKSGDNLHQGPVLANTTLNVYLNILDAAQRRRLGGATEAADYVDEAEEDANVRLFGPRKAAAAAKKPEGSRKLHL